MSTTVATILRDAQEVIDYADAHGPSHVEMAAAVLALIPADVQSARTARGNDLTAGAVGEAVEVIAHGPTASAVTLARLAPVEARRLAAVLLAAADDAEAESAWLAEQAQA